MGSKSHLTPREFSKSFNDFLARVVLEQKDGRLTARWAESYMPKNRGKDYWEKLLRGTQAMTTEDISLIAKWLDVSPFDFVRAVHASDLSAIPNVSSPTDTEPSHLSAEEEEKLRDSMALAAKRKSKRK